MWRLGVGVSYVLNSRFTNKYNDKAKGMAELHACISRSQGSILGLYFTCQSWYLHHINGVNTYLIAENARKTRCTTCVDTGVTQGEVLCPHVCMRVAFVQWPCCCCPRLSSAHHLTVTRRQLWPSNVSCKVQHQIYVVLFYWPAEGHKDLILWLSVSPVWVARIVGRWQAQTDIMRPVTCYSGDEKFNRQSLESITTHRQTGIFVFSISCYTNRTQSIYIAQRQSPIYIYSTETEPNLYI